MYGSYSFGSVPYASRGGIKKNIITQEVEDSLNVSDSIVKQVVKQIDDSMSLTDSVHKNIQKIITDGLSITDELMTKIKTVASFIKGGVGKRAENFLRGKIKR